MVFAKVIWSSYLTGPWVCSGFFTFISSLLLVTLSIRASFFLFVFHFHPPHLRLFLQIFFHQNYRPLVDYFPLKAVPLVS